MYGIWLKNRITIVLSAVNLTIESQNQVEILLVLGIVPLDISETKGKLKHVLVVPHLFTSQNLYPIKDTEIIVLINVGENLEKHL
jgi:hypothetical protein